MSNVHKCAAVQMLSGPNHRDNLIQAKRLIEDAARQDAELIVLPENFAMMTLNKSERLDIKETFGDGPIQQFLSDMAKKYGLWLVGGTIPLAVEGDENKIRSSCLTFNPRGECAGRYDKIHLFDVSLTPDMHEDVDEKSEQYNESSVTEPGEKLCVIDTDVGRIGVAVCYDLRFPELFRAMTAKGVDIFVIPAAFTLTTGMAHWQVLLRSRAIENFCYVIASAQDGENVNGRRTYGHSTIIEPWGGVLEQLSHGPGVICQSIDIERQLQIRHNFPALEHCRFIAKLEQVS